MTLKPMRDLGVVSVSLDLGAGRRGVDMGPSALRVAGLTERLELLGYTVREAGAVTAEQPEAVQVGESRLRFLDPVCAACQETYRRVAQVLEEGGFPLILGGDHSLSIGSVSAVSSHYAARGERIGVLWVDAHTDMNTPETTPSGNIHGMSLAALAGLGPERLTRLMGDPAPAVDARNICVIGARDIDETEKDVVRASGIRVFTMTEIDERGMGAVMDEALTRLNDGTAGFHLSYDLDGLDPRVAPGVGTPVPGGLTYREGHLICEKIARTNCLVSLEVVEVNPVLDRENLTARTAVDMVASALGQAIL